MCLLCPHYFVVSCSSRVHASLMSLVVLLCSYVFFNVHFTFSESKGAFFHFRHSGGC